MLSRSMWKGFAKKSHSSLFLPSVKNCSHLQVYACSKIVSSIPTAYKDFGFDREYRVDFFLLHLRTPGLIGLVST